MAYGMRASTIRAGGSFSWFKLFFAMTIIALSLNLEVALRLAKANPVNKAIMLAALAALLLRGKVEWPRVAALGFMYFGTFLSALLSANPGFQWELYFRGSVSFIVAFGFLTVVPRRDDMRFALHAIAWFPIVSVVIGCFYDLTHIRPLFSVDDLGAMRLGGSTIPAYQAAASACGAFAAFICGDRFRQRGYLYVFVVNLVILFLTAGRMATLAAFISCASVYVWGYRGQLREKIVGMLVVALSVVIVGELVFDALAKRAASESLKGRDLIWTYLQAYVDQYPYFGIGLGHQESIVNSGSENSALSHVLAAHNEYLRFQVECGLVGSACIIVGALALFAITYQSQQIKRSPIFLFGVAAFCIFALTDNAMSQPSIFFMLIVATFGAGKAMEDLDWRKSGKARRALPAPVFRKRLTEPNPQG